MLVDAETYLVLVEVVNGIEVAQEGITDEEQVLVLAGQTALVDHEVTLALVALVQILLWVNLEDVVTHLEAHWLHFLCHLLAWRLDVAECLVRLAIQLWKAIGPLLSDLLEHIWWYRELRASSVYYGGIAGVLSWLLHGLGSVGHSLSLESPSAKPVREVLESLEAICSVDNL